jgi:hypothetical protein
MGDIFDPDFGAFTPISLLRVNAAHPFAALDLDLAVPGALRVQASARLGTYAQTLAQPKSPRSALEGSLGISPVLSFLKVPVLRDVYLRSYGELAYLPASGAFAINAVGLFAQDLVIPFRFSGRASPTLSLEGALYYADSLDQQPVNEYYAPHSALTVKGGLSGSLSFALRNSDRLTYWLHAAGGYAESVDAASGDTVQTALIETSSRWSYARRGALVSVVATGSTAIEEGELSYWSMSMGLEVSTKMPRLLSPR